MQRRPGAGICLTGCFGNSADPAGRAGGRTVQRRLCGDSAAGIRRTVAGGSARGAETSSRSWSRKCRRTWCIGALTTVLAMVLYLLSNSQAVYVHRGAVTDVSIAQEFAAQPLFFLRFLLKAVASSVIGVAQIRGSGGRKPLVCPAASRCICWGWQCLFRICWHCI